MTNWHTICPVIPVDGQQLEAKCACFFNKSIDVARKQKKVTSTPAKDLSILVKPIDVSFPSTVDRTTTTAISGVTLPGKEQIQKAMVKMMQEEWDILPES
jgi:hypothetical protein